MQQGLKTHWRMEIGLPFIGWCQGGGLTVLGQERTAESGSDEAGMQLAILSGTLGSAPFLLYSSPPPQPPRLHGVSCTPACPGALGTLSRWPREVD